MRSKNEAMRLFKQGAIKEYIDGKYITLKNPNELVGKKERKFKIGKKEFVITKPR